MSFNSNYSSMAPRIKWHMSVYVVPPDIPKIKVENHFLVVIYIYECKLRSELLFPVEINSVTLLQNSEIYIWNIRRNALSNAQNQHENFDEFLTFFLKRYRRDILYDS